MATRPLDEMAALELARKCAAKHGMPNLTPQRWVIDAIMQASGGALSVHDCPHIFMLARREKTHGIGICEELPIQFERQLTNETLNGMCKTPILDGDVVLRGVRNDLNADAVPIALFVNAERGWWILHELQAELERTNTREEMGEHAAVQDMVQQVQTALL